MTLIMYDYRHAQRTQFTNFGVPTLWSFMAKTHTQDGTKTVSKVPFSLLEPREGEMINLERKLLYCFRCNHGWLQRTPVKFPKQCPNCSSPYWMNKEHAHKTVAQGRCPYGEAATIFLKLIAIATDDCVLWPYAQRSGYGAVSIEGEIRDTHVTAWEIAHKREVPEGLMICHTCDIKLCINQRHLFLGTSQDNIRDMMRKERGLVGELCPTVKLSDAKVRTILSLTDRVGKDLAAQFNVSRATISRIRTGKRSLLSTLAG
jgi:hypothetical protein